MGTDVEQDDLALRNLQGEHDSIGMGQADRVHTLEFALQRMQTKMRLVWILFKLLQKPRDALT